MMHKHVCLHVQEKHFQTQNCAQWLTFAMSFTPFAFLQQKCS